MARYIDEEEIPEPIKQADKMLAEAADTWAINTDAKFASGVRTGIRLARKIVQKLQDRREDGSVAFTATSGAGGTFASANIMQEVDDGKKEAL